MVVLKCPTAFRIDVLLLWGTLDRTHARRVQVEDGVEAAEQDPAAARAGQPLHLPLLRFYLVQVRTSTPWCA